MPSNRRVVACLSMWLVMLVLTTTSNAAPFVERVDPPSLQRGATTRIVMRGRHLEQPVGVWSSATNNAWATKVIDAPQPLPASPAERFPELHLRSEEPGRTPLRATHDCVLEVTLPSDAPLGLYGLRLATRSGLSNLVIIAIDELPTVKRAELVADPKASVPLAVSLPVSVSADCRTGGIDRYAVEVTAKQRVSFEVIGNRLGKDFDPLVIIRDSAGRVLLQHDNDVGLFFDCRFSYTFQTAGKYVVEVRDARYDGHPYWNYVLRIGDFPASRMAVPSTLRNEPDETVHLPEIGAVGAKPTLRSGNHSDPLSAVGFREVRVAPYVLPTWLPFTSTELENRLEVEPNNDLMTATSAAVPGVLHGVLQAPGEQDFFALELKKGQTLQVTSAARELGSPADLELVLFDHMGKEVRRVDDVQQQRNGIQTTFEARFDFNVGQDGTYKLMVREMSGNGGPAYGYRVEVAEPKPELELFADYGAFTVPQKSWQPLPISVTRTRIAGPIELELIGAPAGVTLEPSTIAAESNELLAKLIIADGAAIGINTFQIRAKCQSSDGKQTATALVKHTPQIDRQLRNKDRIPYAPRDNQGQPPPSVPETFALQVTPTAPFNIDVPVQDLVMTKYQSVTFPIETTRAAGFTAPISFMATGGQIGTEDEERDNVYLRAPDALPNQGRVDGVFYNRILTQYQKKRADLFAIAAVDGHFVTLIRPFQLDVRSAFKPTFEPSSLSGEPGQTLKVKLLANRTPTFDGEVILSMQQPISGASLPATLTIPAGKPDIEIEFKIDADANPRRLSPRFQSTGYVGKYEEEINEPVLNIDIMKPKTDVKPK